MSSSFCLASAKSFHRKKPKGQLSPSDKSNAHGNPFKTCPTNYFEASCENTSFFEVFWALHVWDLSYPDHIPLNWV